MKKTIIPFLIVAFVCGAAFADCGHCGKNANESPKGQAAAGEKGPDCPMDAAASEKHDCPHAKGEHGKAVKDHDCPGEEAGGDKKHDCPGHKDHGAKGEHDKKCAGDCPGHMQGVEKTVKNIENGVETIFTAKDKDAVAKLQEMVAARHSSDAKSGCACPCSVEGAEKKVTNTETGATVTVTGGTPELVKKIQDAAARHGKDKAAGHKCGGHGKETAQAGAKTKAKAAKKYVCPMKCAVSDKPGKCPKCGMNLVEQK